MISSGAETSTETPIIRIKSTTPRQKSLSSLTNAPPDPSAQHIRNKENVFLSLVEAFGSVADLRLIFPICFPVLVPLDPFFVHKRRREFQKLHVAFLPCFCLQSIYTIFHGAKTGQGRFDAQKKQHGFPHCTALFSLI